MNFNSNFSTEFGSFKRMKAESSSFKWPEFDIVADKYIRFTFHYQKSFEPAFSSRTKFLYSKSSPKKRIYHKAKNSDSKHLYRNKCRMINSNGNSLRYLYFAHFSQTFCTFQRKKWYEMRAKKMCRVFFNLNLRKCIWRTVYFPRSNVGSLFSSLDLEKFSVFKSDFVKLEKQLTWIN